MKLRIAFVGFRHGHIYELLDAAEASPHVEVVARCEEDAATREKLKAEGKVEITHTSYDQLLAEVPCDIIATGAVYGERGAILIKALKAGKHIISDKPLCTRLEELDEIESLAKSKGLQVGLQLSLRSSPPMIGLRNVIRSGVIGEPVTVNVTAQHPLNLGVRPEWYFVPGQHGGTINDIGIHAFDIIPWITGSRVSEILAARTWNKRATPYPHFEDCAQLMAKLDNGGGVLADFSYLAPTKLGFKDPKYWEITIHGTKGVAQVCLASKEIRVVNDDDTEPRLIPLPEGTAVEYLTDFLDAIHGRPVREGGLTTEEVLKASREALSAQAAAKP